MNKILKEIGKKIKQFITRKNKLPEEKNTDVGTVYLNGQDIEHISSFSAKVEFEKSDEDKMIEWPINKSYEFSARLIISPSLKRTCNRVIENKRLLNILRNTRKNRTKKKLAKRIKKNNTLNKLDK